MVPPVSTGNVRGNYFFIMNSKKPVRCSLCEQVIAEYTEDFNHLPLDPAHSIDICRPCLDKIVKWQQGVYAKLFPTKASKKYLGKRSHDG